MFLIFSIPVEIEIGIGIIMTEIENGIGMLKEIEIDGIAGIEREIEIGVDQFMILQRVLKKKKIILIVTEVVSV